jgi:iron-sulfur cluster assembly protein
MVIKATETTELETVEPIVLLTPTAIKQVRRQMTKLNRVGEYLRLGVRGGGCSGLSYVIDFEDDPDPEFDLIYTQALEDEESDISPVNVVIDRKSALFLKETTLNYNIKNLMEGGFIFENPNALRSCGCGTSFTAK